MAYMSESTYQTISHGLHRWQPSAALGALNRRFTDLDHLMVVHASVKRIGTFLACAYASWTGRRSRAGQRDTTYPIKTG